jgi:hypothetical protein
MANKPADGWLDAYDMSHAVSYIASAYNKLTKRLALLNIINMRVFNPLLSSWGRNACFSPFAGWMRAIRWHSARLRVERRPVLSPFLSLLDHVFFLRGLNSAG